ncbi:MAG TPA: TrmH family RNA methyltransferase [Candidatus Saccharimonadales bacterium]|nr:TrmH family RNA methyltransferase [Candidatus Saccharimonadales bacterium]
MDIVVIAHNIRSTYNVGSILRTADGFGVRQVIMTGYTPYPTQTPDTRLPHLRDKITKQIHKTALGAETAVPTEYHEDPLPILTRLRDTGYQLLALEQSPRSVMLPSLNPSVKVALLLGEEVNGIAQNLLTLCDVIVEIPMRGAKESFNVSVATGIALYELSKRAH